MSDEFGKTQPASSATAQQTVWRHDAAVAKWGDEPPESHWSRQTTQPLGARWPAQMRRRVDAQRNALVARRESRAMGIGAGWGALAMLAVVALLVVLAAVNGWLPGSSSPSSDSTQFPVPVQSVSHTPIPNATTAPASTAQPTATAQSTATAQPTTTAQPTATSQPTATPAPTAQSTKVP